MKDKKPFKPAKGKGGKASLLTIGGVVAAIGLIYVFSSLYFNLPRSAPEPPRRRTSEVPRRRDSDASRPVASKPKSADRKRDVLGVPLEEDPNGVVESDDSKRRSSEWTSLPRSLPECIKAQEELMTIPVHWPGFHALCIETMAETHMSVLLHRRSGQRIRQPEVADVDPSPPSSLRAEGLRFPGDTPRPQMLIDGLIEQLKAKLLQHEFQPVDNMISTSAYDFPPNPWALFTQVGNPVLSDEDLRSLGPGAALYLYTGGQFIWPGVRIGHKTRVPIPITHGTEGEGGLTHKIVEMTTMSLRPTVMVLSGFLTEAECAFIKDYAKSRMVPSGLAMMDSSGDSKDVRTSTQTFMERSGSAQIRALEERAHNLTRLPYDNGENIQVVRYEKGQKYGAHRDFFNPNDYHKQPAMLKSVEYGARNRLATVFWYLQSVSESGESGPNGPGGETFFPRALNAEGREYNPWNGDHEDCYRGLYVPPVRGNAVLFYSMVPDGRLDERALHGGCRPRLDNVEKWGANQWIWNHPHRKTHSGTYPRKVDSQARRAAAAQAAAAGKPGCVDQDPENCAAWAASGECEKNAAYMAEACKASCGKC